MKDTLIGLLACAALIILGGLMLAKPELMWKLEHFLDVKDGHPSEWYETKSRVGGTIFLIIGLVGLFLMAVFGLLYLVV